LCPIASGHDAYCHGHSGRPHRAVHYWLDVRSVLFTTECLSACFACGTDRCRNFKAI
jgi:hypothetical protein